MIALNKFTICNIKQQFLRPRWGATKTFCPLWTITRSLIGVKQNEINNNKN